MYLKLLLFFQPADCESNSEDELSSQEILIMAPVSKQIPWLLRRKPFQHHQRPVLCWLLIIFFYCTSFRAPHPVLVAPCSLCDEASAGLLRHSGEVQMEKTYSMALVDSHPELILGPWHLVFKHLSWILVNLPWRQRRCHFPPCSLRTRSHD